MNGNFIVWAKAKYASRYMPNYFENLPEIANAILAGVFSEEPDIIITRRMALRIVDAEEVVIPDVVPEGPPSAMETETVAAASTDEPF